MVETVSIQIDRYRDKDAQPTCSIGRASTETCQLMRVTNWGFVQVCGWTHTELTRRPNDGTLIPCDGCPVWLNV